MIRQLLQRTLLRRRDLAAIELLVCDVDGVLTDGGLHYDEQGQVVKRFDVRDGRSLCSPLRDNLATYPVRIEDGVVFVAL